MKQIVCIVVAALLAGCGENLEGPTVSGAPGRPRDLSALSVNSGTVNLRWSAPTGADTNLTGYVISWGGLRDTVARTVTVYSVTGLGPGLISFSVLSLGPGGAAGAPVTILWAPASRFDSGLTIGEYFISDTSRHIGLDVGTQTTDPFTMTLNAAAQNGLDFFLYGEAGQALTLRSANLYLPTWNQTLFSPVQHQAPNLDLYLTSFPTVYSLSEVVVSDNTIYYARVTGSQGAVLYVRFHIRVLPGSFPSRSIAIRLSLQRLPGVQAA